MNSQDIRDVWLMTQRVHGCSVDRMLCSPKLRNEFLADVRQLNSSADEENTLWSLVRLRKNKSLPRTER